MINQYINTKRAMKNFLLVENILMKENDISKIEFLMRELDLADSLVGEAYAKDTQKDKNYDFRPFKGKYYRTILEKIENNTVCN